MPSDAGNTITYRWIDGPRCSAEDWDRISDVCVKRGWMMPNSETSRILVAEDEGQLIGFVILQLCPHLEPLFVSPSYRGSGVAEELADRAVQFMQDIQARGWITIAEHPSAVALCEREGMKKVECPVYIKVNTWPDS